jgi:hypothetical protein
MTQLELPISLQFGDIITFRNPEDNFLSEYDNVAIWLNEKAQTVLSVRRKEIKGDRVLFLPGVSQLRNVYEIKGRLDAEEVVYELNMGEYGSSPYAKREAVRLTILQDAAQQSPVIIRR